jgi:ornithine cyclodeaminase/alanine dehydrogenase-like protein (mu-crystallin family)
MQQNDIQTQKILTDLDKSFVEDRAQETSILDALQHHYDTLQKNQERYIAYITELVAQLKTTQHQDKESLAQLKKQVLKHVLSKEK